MYFLCQYYTVHVVVSKGDGSGKESQLTTFILDCIAWRFLSKLSELRKWGNRANTPKATRSLGERWLSGSFSTSLALKT